MLYDLGSAAPEIAPDAWVAPNAAVIGDVKLLPGSSIWFGAILRGDIETITVGNGSNVQDGTVMHTDPDNPCTLGDYVTVGHMAMLHGCTVGDGSLIGIGATMLNGSRVGARCIVGAHTLITEGKEFPDGVLIMGTPGKVVRELNDDDFARMRANADRYIERARRYALELLAQ
ncbi:MAG: gamma carbonic anhydrase family protein [Gammaproteobacteria bacterium]|nr:gamma carbonic anhydrase family protein [Gammaproteobacteria bacterium]NND55589.1 gamma carbonic anhydrase family protein [Gammaproteobacteria bacterium]